MCARSLKRTLDQDLHSQRSRIERRARFRSIAAAPRHSHIARGPAESAANGGVSSSACASPPTLDMPIRTQLWEPRATGSHTCAQGRAAQRAGREHVVSRSVRCKRVEHVEHADQAEAPKAGQGEHAGWRQSRGWIHGLMTALLGLPRGCDAVGRARSAALLPLMDGVGVWARTTWCRTGWCSI